MKTHAVRLAVALATFVVGVSLATLMFSRPTMTTIRPAADGVLKSEVLEFQSDCGPDGGGSKGKREETPEEKAVRLAEEFVARNGYTDLPPDKDALSYEGIEWETNVDEMLKSRHNTLERKAYGILNTGKMGGPGWIVAFRYKRYYGSGFEKVGRAVTMDENFRNLRVEHSDLFLNKVEKKL